MARWRDVKSGKIKHKPQSKPQNKQVLTDLVPNPWRLKAFIIDMFMIMMPIMYIITYGILGGKNDFLESELAHIMGSITFGIITSLFIAISGQTIGLKAYEIKVVDANTGKKLSFIRAFYRYLLFLLSATILIGILMPLFRKDNKTLHDILSNSMLIHHPNDKSA